MKRLIGEGMSPAIARAEVLGHQSRLFRKDDPK